MKVTIVIEDNPNGSCNVTFTCDPPLARLQPGEQPSAARVAMNEAFAAIKAAASSIKTESYISRTP
jgi:hypothetical protein